jgi:hypothetical protein
MPSLPGAASTAVRDLLEGPPAAGRVVAVFPSCVYADVAGRLVAVEAFGALRLPCAVVLGARAADRPFAGVQLGDAVAAGDGVLRAGPLEVPVARWWAPARPCGATPRRDTSVSAGWDRLALRLLGAGPGLTPAGDDVLAGLLLGLASRADLRDPLAAAVQRNARARTTWLSAELLRLAADGLGAPAVVAVADALAGHGPDDALARALPPLLAVGHTSGQALAQGLLLAAETVAHHPEKHLEAA